MQRSLQLNHLNYFSLIHVKMFSGWLQNLVCSILSHPRVRKMQIFVGRSSIEILQDMSPGGRELQRGEMRPALLLTGCSRHNVPVDAEIPVTFKERLLMFASVTMQRAVSHAVFQKTVQTQTQFQIFYGLRPLLCGVTVQSQSIRSSEGHELLVGEINETVVFILRQCHKRKTKANHGEQHISLCAQSHHDKIISYIVCFLCAPPATFPLSAWWSAQMLRGLWEFRDWAFRSCGLGFLSVGWQLPYKPALLCFLIWLPDSRA